jgi:ribonuclease E
VTESVSDNRAELHSAAHVPQASTPVEPVDAAALQVNAADTASAATTATLASTQGDDETAAIGSSMAACVTTPQTNGASLQRKADGAELTANLVSAGLTMIETSSTSSYIPQAAPIKLGRKPRPAVVIADEPLQMVETQSVATQAHNG